jgi:hypothetical protein
MNDLLKEAIADAKAVREVALANAKLALEEAFTPRLQSMLSKKLSEEAEMDDDESKEVEEEGVFNEFAMGEGEDEAEDASDEHGEAHEEPKEEGAGYDDMDEYFAEAEGSEEKDLEERISELEKHMAKFEAKDSDEEESVEETEHNEDEEEIDEDLMEIIRQLEEDLASSEIGKGDNKKPSAKASDDSTQDPAGSQKVVQLVEEEEDEEKVDESKEEDEDVNEILRAIREEEDSEEKVEEANELDINEILRALREEEDEEEKVEEAKDGKELEEAKGKLREAYAVISFLRSKINEVNLLNSKLLFTNKLFKKHSLSENQKMTVIENFDRASSLREVKLVFATLSEALKSAKTNIKPLKESFASKPIASTRPKNVINEGDDVANRLRKLAGLK